MPNEEFQMSNQILLGICHLTLVVFDKSNKISNSICHAERALASRSITLFQSHFSTQTLSINTHLYCTDSFKYWIELQQFIRQNKLT